MIIKMVKVKSYATNQQVGPRHKKVKNQSKTYIWRKSNKQSDQSQSHDIKQQKMVKTRSYVAKATLQVK